MFTIGELFVKLGFNVDDAKLKSFNEDLGKTYQSVLKLSEAATVTGGVLAAFVQHAADAAVHLNNMQHQFGTNTQAAQTFANALHQVNSEISVAEGQNQFNSFNAMLKGELPWGQGASGALSMLGANYRPGTGQSAEDLIANMAKAFPDVLRNLSPDKGEQVALYSKQLEKLHLGGDIEVIRLLSEHPDRYNAASKYNTPDDWNKKLGEAAKATGELSEAFTHFTTQIATILSGPMTTAVNAITAALNGLEHFNENHPAIAGAEGVAGGAAVALGGWALMRRLFGARAAAGAAGAAGGASAAGGMGLARMLGIGGLLTYGLYNSPVGDGIHSFFDAEEEGALWIANKIKGGNASSGGAGSRGQRNNNRGNIKYGAFARAHGATGADSGGFAVFPDQDSGDAAIAALMSIYGHTGRDSIDSIVNSYTSGDPKKIQDNYKKALSGVTGRGINDHLNMQDPATISRLVSGIIRQENGAKSMTQNNTFNIKSDNPHEVAKAVEMHLQTQLNRTYSQTNQGANY